MTASPTDALPAALPFISIVMPTRNRAHLLAQALRTIAAQTFSRFEVIVLDDASDAATAAEYPALWASLDSRFILHRLGQPGGRGLGPSVTRNAGIALARGEIIAFCDDDDLWTSAGHLTAVATVFATQPDVDMYIANQTGVSSRGTEIANWLPKLRGAAGGGPVTIDALCEAGGFAHLNILSVRKTRVLQAQGFWERVSYEEDRDFFWRTLDCCQQIHFNPTVIAQHNIPDAKRADNQSTQHSVVERWLLAVLVCQHIATTVKHPAIGALARRYEGDLLRKLTTHLVQAGQRSLGFAFAQRALAARFSYKWCGYLMLLAIKSLLPRKVA